MTVHKIADESGKTLPWADDEMMIINGRKYAYCVLGDEIRVWLPGRRHALLSKLMDAGHSVIVPARIRN
jgi:hypothetical protein